MRGDSNVIGNPIAGDGFPPIIGVTTPERVVRWHSTTDAHIIDTAIELDPLPH